jgi:hypothetical protein
MASESESNLRLEIGHVLFIDLVDPRFQALVRKVMSGAESKHLESRGGLRLHRPLESFLTKTWPSEIESVK